VADMRVGGERFAFDDDVWTEEVGRLGTAGRAHAAAVTARAQIERPGSRVAVRACDADAADGTRLAGCAKVYVPLEAEPSRAPYGFVFAIRTDAASGRVGLRLLAYGERHPGLGRSVYERAHRRLHGRYPGQYGGGLR
jgi:hypothetical protein